MYLSRVRSLLLVVFVAAVAAGCGESTLSSPTGPSALTDAAGAGVDTASDVLASTSDDALAALDGGRGSNSGGGNGKDKEKEKQEKDKSDRGPGLHRDEDDEDEDDDRARHRRNLSGFVTAVGTDSITIRAVVVKLTPTTVIRHGHRRLTLAQIAVGDHAQAKGMMGADGRTFTASEIKVEDTGRDNDDDEDDEDRVEVKGAVVGLPTSLPCPALTFTIGTTTVKTSSATVFDDVTCATLANGNIVEVEGVRQADGSILATKVELESGPNEVKGVISGLASTAGCPSLTFTVGTTTVTTSSTTVFSGVACTALANGRRVEVEGTLTGTTLAAARVELDD